ncbi:pilus assembly protein PilO [Sporosarcina sp. 179-K 3D1 HS]|uniref:pilus assembly protein PilO n=1 Tax=Sporosarcina sp. 179-K 3D1 HS TaxID=3232169 RepID=UPI0039A11DD4
MSSWSKRQKEGGLLFLAIVFLIALCTYSYFLIYAPAKTANEQMKQAIANERDVLFALRKQAAGQAISNETAGGTQPLQRKVPVKPLEEAVLLQIERAEIKSGSFVHDVTFTNSDYVIENPPEHVEHVNRLLTEVYLEAASYLDVQRFIDEIEKMERIYVIESITIDAPEELREMEAEQEPMKMTVAFNAFYRGDLIELAPEAPKTDAPLPAEKVDPTPFNNGVAEEEEK